MRYLGYTFNGFTIYDYYDFLSLKNKYFLKTIRCIKKKS